VVTTNINCVLGHNASQNMAIFKIFFQSLYIILNATAGIFSLATQRGTLWHHSYFARKRFSAYSNLWASSGWFVWFWHDSPQRVRASSFPRFLDHIQRRTTVGRTPLLSSQRPLPDNTHNTHNRQTSMPPVGFEPTISTGERPQNYAFYHAVTGTGLQDGILYKGVWRHTFAL